MKYLMGAWKILLSLTLFYLAYWGFKAKWAGLPKYFFIFIGILTINVYFFKTEKQK